MRHRKIKRPMVPALVFTVAGVLIGLMHVPLPPVLLPAAALGGIWLMPMLSGRNESDKCNKHNYIRGCSYSLEKSYSYGQTHSSYGINDNSLLILLTDDSSFILKKLV